ncbi:hypothetical protein F183_A23000 [Bryobacterales bacterium F-183]|nr:hypothetical protein F183_A23000 [Bryobacterales bacterium F-183]
MMMIKTLVATVAVAATLSAQAKKAPAQHAHSHGEAKINIGIEGNGGTVEIEAAADPIIGFEHKPKNAAEQKKVDAALANLKARVAQAVVIPASYGCAFTPKEVHFEVEGSHAEVHAEFAIKCAKPLKGATITFGLSKLYPEIESVKVQAVSDAGQTGATIKKDAGSVKIS